MFLFRKQPDPKPLPPWLKLAVIAFVLYSLFLSATGQSPTGNVQGNLQTIDWSKQFNWEDYKAKVFPGMNDPLRITDGTQGKGQAALCGQEVSIRFTAFLPDGKQVDGNMDKPEPLKFILGAGTQAPAFEQGLLGMRVGGKRTIAAAPHMAYGAKGTGMEHAELSTYMVRYEVELLALAPEMPLPSGPDKLSLRAFDYAIASSGALACGNTATIKLAVWKADGTLLYANTGAGDKPLTLKLGAAQAPLGLEQGLLGLSPERRRTLIVPPALTRRLRETPLSGEIVPPGISLPEDQTLVMDVAFVPPENPQKEK